jgi:acetolactate synthase-1/2/3 large subunit
VSEADLVLFIGSATGDQVTLDWSIPAIGTEIIQIDINPSELGRNYPGALGILGDARTVLRQMLVGLTPDRDRSAWNRQVREYVREWRELIAVEIASDAAPIRPERLCHEIGIGLPDNAILVSDTGYSCVWAGTMISITRPTQRFLRAAGSLGWAFPAALGAKCAAPDRPVLCFCGDGAFLYQLSELETARRWGINTVTVVNNNSYFGQSIPGMVKAYGATPGNPDQIVQFEETNYAKIAEEFGCLGIRVEDPAEIAPALRSAWKADKPVVIDVVTDPHCHPPSIWRAG